MACLDTCRWMSDYIADSPWSCGLSAYRSLPAATDGRGAGTRAGLLSSAGYDPSDNFPRCHSGRQLESGGRSDYVNR